MGREKLRSAFWAAVIATTATFGSVGCMVTGLWLENVKLWLLAVVCAVSAVAGAVCFQSKLRRLPLCVLALLGIFFWMNGSLSLSAERLLCHISDLYDQGYGWGILRWSDADLANAGMMPALSFWCSTSALVVARTVTGRRGAWLTVPVVALPLVTCMVLTDTAPQASYLYVFLFGVVLLLLTQVVRCADLRQGNRLSALVALPVALGLGILFLLVPQEGYSGQEGAQKLQQIVTDWFSEIDAQEQPKPTLPPSLDGYGVGSDVSEEKVHLKQVGPRKPGMDTVMTVTAQENRVLYLRSCAYDHYDGISWRATQQPWVREMEFAESYGQMQTLSLQTVAVHDTLYFTYTPVQGDYFRYGRAENTQNLKIYTIRYGVPETYRDWWDTVNGRVDPEEMAQYLQLPQNTRERAAEILAGKGFSTDSNSAGDIYRCAAEIAGYVRSSAVYDLNTQRMPMGETDFALWFLENSETGYCVHYASAAAVLLRAAGIPARYVTGYLVDARENETVSVKAKSAHAWVECYIGGIGWIMLEPTAAGSNSPVTQTTEATMETTDATVQTTEGTSAATTVETAGSLEATEDRPAVTTGRDTPGDAGSVEMPGEEPDEEGLRFLGAILWCLLGIVAVIFQWQLRVWLRQRRQHSGRTNAQALARWQEAVLLSRLSGQPPEETLHALAQKAKFSSHTITQEELHRFDTWMAQTKKVLRKRPVWYQLLYTLILALY